MTEQFTINTIENNIWTYLNNQEKLTNDFNVITETKKYEKREKQLEQIEKKQCIIRQEKTKLINAIKRLKNLKERL